MRPERDDGQRVRGRAVVSVPRHARPIHHTFLLANITRLVVLLLLREPRPHLTGVREVQDGRVDREPPIFRRARGRTRWL